MKQILKTIILLTAVFYTQVYSQSVKVTGDSDEKYDTIKASVAYSNIRSDAATFFGTSVPVDEGHGLTITLDYKLRSGNHYRLGAVAELTKNLNRTTFYDYLFGTQLSFPLLHSKVEPFVKATFGVHQVKLDSDDPTPLPLLAQQLNDFSFKAFAHSVGVGVDVNVSEHFFVRPIVVERFAFDGALQRNTKVSAGFGFRY